MSKFISCFDVRSKKFRQQLENYRLGDVAHLAKVHKTVTTILQKVNKDGDRAILKYTKKFDRIKASRVNDLKIPLFERKKILKALPQQAQDVLNFATKRIYAYHQRQLQESTKAWHYTDDIGMVLRQIKIPIKRVGIYAPAGSGSYASSVLMCSIPAQIAGVNELVMMTPAYGLADQQLMLAASALMNIHEVYTIGGAQAIGALAYGSESIAKVDKIIGPGNAYVSTAKSIVRNITGTDTVAGPSELVIICDNSVDPDYVVLDLFAQAEHDTEAKVTLLCPDQGLIELVLLRIGDLLPTMKRSNIIAQSLKKHGAIVKVNNIEEAIKISNYLAPEHLSLMVKEAQELLSEVQNAGAIFLGQEVAQVLGDYCAGSNHVLPTGGRAQFESMLNVDDFCKYSSVIEGMPNDPIVYEMTAAFAELEGLEAHACAARSRLKRFNPIKITNRSLNKKSQ